MTEGSGRLLVLAVGGRSEWGKTMAMVATESQETPLQEALGLLAAAIGKVGLLVGGVCFIVLLIRCGHLLHGSATPTAMGNAAVSGSIRKYFLNVLRLFLLGLQHMWHGWLWVACEKWSALLHRQELQCGNVLVVGVGMCACR